MSFLGTIQGTGQVIANGESIGVAEYELTVFQKDDSSQETNGTLMGDMELLKSVSEADAAALVLETGETVAFTVTDLRIGSATIEISEPLPGF